MSAQEPLASSGKGAHAQQDKFMEQVNDFIVFSLFPSSAFPSSVENGTVDTPAAEPEDVTSQTSSGAGEEEDLMQFEPTQEELEKERLTAKAEQVSLFGTILFHWLRLDLQL